MALTRPDDAEPDWRAESLLTVDASPVPVEQVAKKRVAVLISGAGGDHTFVHAHY
jgi:hypothetical protein